MAKKIESLNLGDIVVFVTNSGSELRYKVMATHLHLNNAGVRANTQKNGNDAIWNIVKGSTLNKSFYDEASYAYGYNASSGTVWPTFMVGDFPAATRLVNALAESPRISSVKVLTSAKGEKSTFDKNNFAVLVSIGQMDEYKSLCERFGVPYDNKWVGISEGQLDNYCYLTKNGDTDVMRIEQAKTISLSAYSPLTFKEFKQLLTDKPNKHEVQKENPTVRRTITGTASRVPGRGQQTSTGSRPTGNAASRNPGRARSRHLEVRKTIVSSTYLG